MFCFKWSYYLLVFCVYIYNVQNHFTSFMMLSLPHVIFKPGSSGRRQTALSPSLYLSLSWRGPLGKSSSLRLSKKKKYSTVTHCMTAQPCLSAANISRFFSGLPEALLPSVILFWEFLLLVHIFTLLIISSLWRLLFSPTAFLKQCKNLAILETCRWDNYLYKKKKESHSTEFDFEIMLYFSILTLSD